ncbi:hypothetical protein PPOP_3087, partial [Paenibacillus popilliae ATCC 14706]
MILSFTFAIQFSRYKKDEIYGGAKEDRTPDLLLARQALSQLSYGPKMNSIKTEQMNEAIGSLCFLYVSVAGDVFLRKEVIQPHLPIRLPCYDFTPI